MRVSFPWILDERDGRRLPVRKPGRSASRKDCAQEASTRRMMSGILGLIPRANLRLCRENRHFSECPAPEKTPATGQVERHGQPAHMLDQDLDRIRLPAPLRCDLHPFAYCDGRYLPLGGRGTQPIMENRQDFDAGGRFLLRPGGFERNVPGTIQGCPER